MTRVMYLLLKKYAVPCGQLRSKKIGVSPNKSPLNPELTGSSFPHRDDGSLLKRSRGRKSAIKVVQSSMLVTPKSTASPPLYLTACSMSGKSDARVTLVVAGATGAGAVMFSPCHMG